MVNHKAHMAQEEHGGCCDLDAPKVGTRGDEWGRREDPIRYTGKTLRLCPSPEAADTLGMESPR